MHPQCHKVQTSRTIIFLCFFDSISTLFDLSRFCFSWLYFEAHTEGNFALFEFTFLHLSHTALLVLYYEGRQCGSKQSLISLRTLWLSLIKVGQQVHKLFTRNSGRGTLGFRFSPGWLAGCYAYALRAQLSFHAFLAVFSSGTHTLTTHKHDGFTIENWLSRGRAQLLLIFVRFTFCCFTRKNDYVKRKKKLSNFQALQSPRMVAKRFPQSGNNKNSTHTRGRLLPRTNNHYDLNPRNHTSPVW